MKRTALKHLVSWKEKENRKPMLIHGARQVGKTWLMNEFGKSYYKSVFYINFERNQRIRDLFNAGDLDPDRLITGLEIEFGQKIIPRESLIIFDEIQEAPKAITSLKYFYEEKPQYHITAAGSLLGVALHGGISYPVGKVDTMTLYPLNFREFLNALGEENLCRTIDSGDYELLKVFKDKLTDYVKQYFYIGGMPEVAADFIKNKDFANVRKIQNQILDAYKNDFSKHIS
ncbi:MAG: AAA family ATPase, partial [Endomicrobium sp.]|nr:AAA family ATPase [Endomicrobium sp.]